MTTNHVKEGRGGKMVSEGCCHVNRLYLPIKLVYFVFSAACGAVIPFLGVYLMQMGLHEGETGVILGALPILSFLPQLVLSALADKLRHPILVLTLLLLLTGGFYVGLLSVPAREASASNQTSTSSPIPCHSVENDTDEWLQCLNVPETCCPVQAPGNGGSAVPFPLHVNQSDVPEELLGLESSSPGLTFWLAFVLLFAGTSSRLSVHSLMDCVAYNILGENGHLWGRQRLWGSLGYATAAVGTTLASDMMTSNSAVIDFRVNFYTFLVLTVATAGVALWFRVTESSGTRVQFRALTNVMMRPTTIVFLLLLVFYGAAHGTLQAFAFWLVVEELETSQTILGLAILVSVVGEVIFFFIAGPIIRKFGHKRSYLVALPVYALRLGCTSLLSAPWQLLPLELLHGVTFALTWAAVTSYASHVAPPALEASMQAAVATAYTALGKGGGCLVSGWLAEALGKRWTFRLYAAIALAIFTPVALIGLCNLKNCKEKINQHELEACATSGGTDVKAPEAAAPAAAPPAREKSHESQGTTETATRTRNTLAVNTCTRGEGKKSECAGRRVSAVSCSDETSIRLSNVDSDMDMQEMLLIQKRQNPLSGTRPCSPSVFMKLTNDDETCDDEDDTTDHPMYHNRRLTVRTDKRFEEVVEETASAVNVLE